MNFWKAAAIQLLAISLREFRYQDKLADTSHCLVPEVSCTCSCDPPELPSREFHWLELIGGVVIGSTGSLLIVWSLKKGGGKDGSPAPPGRDWHRRRRGGGVLSDHEAGEEVSSLVQ